MQYHRSKPVRPPVLGALVHSLLLPFAVGLLLIGVAAPAVSADPAPEILGPKKTPEDIVEIEAKIAKLEKRTPLTGENYRDQYELGNLYYDVGQLQFAEARYRRAIELNPKFTKALVNLGTVLSDQNRLKDAVEQFEAALNLDPEDCKARSNLGNAYYSQERYPDAMYQYQRAIDIDPDCYSAYFNIAVAFADAGIFREAVKWWRDVVRIAPGTGAARQAQENIDLLKPLVSGKH